MYYEMQVKAFWDCRRFITGWLGEKTKAEEGEIKVVLGMTKLEKIEG